MRKHIFAYTVAFFFLCLPTIAAATSCTSGADCTAGYCLQESCGAPGQCALYGYTTPCVDLPEDKVCGCDGKTYNKFCEAMEASVSIKQEGACPFTLPGLCVNDAGCDSGEYCKKNSCDDATGTCTSKPNFCFPTSSPICGCDEKDYGNSCYAEMKGINVMQSGSCPFTFVPVVPPTSDPDTCTSDNSCDAQSYCKKDSCDDAQGACTTKPEICVDVFDPVCGCNEQEYQNSCSAAVSGINVQNEGTCPVEANTDPEENESSEEAESESQETSSNNEGCAGFTDVESSHADCEAFTFVKSLGAMTGNSDGTLRPSDILQRDQVAKIALETFSLYEGATDYCQGLTPFPDVASTAWSYQYICRGLDLNMITGYQSGPDAGKYIPARSVNRVEFLALLLRNIADTIPSDDSTSYTDVDSGQWFSGFAKYSYDHSLFVGNALSPTKLVSRGEVATIIYKLHQLGKL